MADPAFDTLEATEALARAGLRERHARAIAAAVRKAAGGGAATKADVRALDARIDALKANVGAIKAELGAIGWGLGFMLAVVLAMAGRMFGVL